MIFRSVIWGLIATSLLSGLYFGVLTLISGWEFAVSQFQLYKFFILTLAFGFGVQVGLFSYIRQMSKRVSGGVLAMSGTTSTGAMLACCAHYLVNLIPILGVTGLVALVAQYQVKLFWLGILSQLAGITYLTLSLRAIPTKSGSRGNLW